MQWVGQKQRPVAGPASSGDWSMDSRSGCSCKTSLIPLLCFRGIDFTLHPSTSGSNGFHPIYRNATMTQRQNGIKEKRTRTAREYTRRRSRRWTRRRGGGRPSRRIRWRRRRLWRWRWRWRWKEEGSERTVDDGADGDDVSVKWLDSRLSDRLLFVPRSLQHWGHE